MKCRAGEEKPAGGPEHGVRMLAGKEAQRWMSIVFLGGKFWSRMINHFVVGEK